jgi:hypothetical protein
MIPEVRACSLPHQPDISRERRSPRRLPDEM